MKICDNMIHVFFITILFFG